MSVRELSREESQDRIKWRRLKRNTDPTQKWERMRNKKNISKFKDYLVKF